MHATGVGLVIKHLENTTGQSISENKNKTKDQEEGGKLSKFFKKMLDDIDVFFGNDLNNN